MLADRAAVPMAEVGETESAHSAAALEPVPVRLTVCGLPVTLFVTLKLPVRVPDAVGVNVTLMLQFPPAASEPPHVLLAAKSPLATMLVIVSAALPVFDGVTVCAAWVFPTV